MKTKELTRCAFLCAIYGVLLFINSQTGLFIEGYFPWLFSLPVFGAAALYGWKKGGYTLIGMMALTFILSGLSTWIFSFSYLMAGWLLGSCVREGWNQTLVLSLVFGLLFLLNYLSFTLLAVVMGYDSSEDAALAEFLKPYISWQGFLVLSSAVYSFLQTVLLALLSLLAQMRFRRLFPAPRPLPVLHVGLPVLYAFGILSGFLILCFYVLECPVVIRDLIVIAWLVSFYLLDYAGWRFFLGRLKAGQRRRFSFWLTLGALIPISAPVFAAAGGYAIWKNRGQENKK